MIKPQLKISLEAEVQKRLHEIGARYSMSGNAIVAAAACELSRIRPEDLWHALGRIAGDGALELLPDGRESLPAARKQAKPALIAGQ